MFSKVTALTLLFAPLLAVAQYDYPPPAAPTSAPAAASGSSAAAAPSSTAPAAAAAPSAPPNTPGNVNVDVAFNKTFVFNPSNFMAANGTKVNFFFPNSPVPHSVSQSSFAAPCTYLAASGSAPGGFDSGLQVGKQFTITITDDSKPIWFHCKQVGHCGLGMVGSINAPATGNTFDAFKAAALAIGSAEVAETDSGFVSGGVNAQATASPVAAVASAKGSGSGAAPTATKASSAVKFTAGSSAALIVVAAIFVSI